jgi:hypothetical protein
MAISSALGSSALVLAGNGFRNLLINGAMQVAQRGTSTAGIAGAVSQTYYTADRYATTVLGTAGTWTQSVATTSVDYPTGSGFRQSLKMTCTTATTPLGATAACFINQRIEGQNLQAIRKGTSSAQQLTLSFWVKSGVVGTYIASLYDFPNNRQVSRAYTINVADTWEYKTLVYPPDATGEFNNNAAVGLQLTFALAAGSNYSSGTLQTSWGTYVAANELAGQVNLAAGNNAAVNYWQITGAQLSVGSVAVPFEFKSYADDLRDCQRYYYRHAAGVGVPIVNGSYYQTNTFFGMLHFPTTMRIAPSLSYSSVANSYRIFRLGAPETFTDLYTQSLTENSYTLYTVGLSTTAGTAGWMETAVVSSAFVAFQAEL